MLILIQVKLIQVVVANISGGRKTMDPSMTEKVENLNIAEPAKVEKPKSQGKDKKASEFLLKTAKVNTFRGQILNYLFNFKCSKLTISREREILTRFKWPFERTYSKILSKFFNFTERSLSIRLYLNEK